MNDKSQKDHRAFQKGYKIEKLNHINGLFKKLPL